MPEIGNYVIYGANGVCRVSDCRKMTFAGSSRPYYILTPLGDENSSVLVPADNPALVAKMRPLISRDEIIALIRKMPEVSFGWISDTALRNEKYSRVLESGDRLALLKMIESIYEKRAVLLEQRKKLWSVDENAVRRAEKMLYDEFAIVLELPPEQIPEFVRTVLATI